MFVLMSSIQWCVYSADIYRIPTGCWVCWALETSPEGARRRQLEGLPRGGGHCALTCWRECVQWMPTFLFGNKGWITPAAGITAHRWPSATSLLGMATGEAPHARGHVPFLGSALTLPGECLAAGLLPLPNPLTFSFQLFPKLSSHVLTSVSESAPPETQPAICV